LATKVGEEVNFANLANDCGVSPRTIRNYLQVLDDTLVGFLLPPFRKTRQRKAISRSKFYFFDVGVANSLSQIQSLSPATEHYGRCFEQFLLLELRAYLSYRRRNELLYFWKSQSGFEVDVVVSNQLALEVKSTEFVQARHLRGLKVLREEGIVRQFCVVSRDPEERVMDGITILPWQRFLERLWSDMVLPGPGSDPAADPKFEA
jgi:predicted AAA+ superfamily ATPase